MPSNTPNGYPYPVASDPVAQGATAIQNLASAVDTKLGVMAAGVVSVNCATIGQAANTTLTFPAGRFPSAPNVAFTSTQGATQPQNSANAPASITATGMTVYATRTAGSTGALNVGWLAMLI